VRGAEIKNKNDGKFATPLWNRLEGKNEPKVRHLQANYQSIKILKY
jgi:hypothetical protein